MEQEKKKKSPLFKGITIGCGSLLTLFIIIIIIAAVFGSGDPRFDKAKSPTNQSSITLSASNAYKNAKIELYQNGTEKQELKSDNKGKFTVQVELKEGDNKFKASATNEKGKTKTGKEINIVYDKTPPTLILSQTKVETDSDKSEITGETEKHSTLTLWTNDKEIGKTTTKDGKFKFNVGRINSGENKFIIKVTDEAGNVGEQKEVIVIYTPKKAPETTNSTTTPTATSTPAPTQTPSSASTPRYPNLTEETMDKNLVLSCEGGDEVVLWDKPTGAAGGASFKYRIPCGTLGWAFNKYFNEELKVTFYAINTNDTRVDNAYGWVTEDLITWR